MSNKNYILQVLGTAQDAGYPQLNCYCKNCQQARSDFSKKRLQSSLALIDQNAEKSYIFDITPAFPEQLSILNKTAAKNKINTNHLSGLFVTHAHLGHYTGILFLGKEAMNVKNLPIYLSEKLYYFLRKNEPWATILNKHLQINILMMDKIYNIDNSFQIKAIEVPHRNEYADTAAFYIKTKKSSFIYLPDLDRWDDCFAKMLSYFEKSDYIFIDGTFYNREELGKIRKRDIKDVPHPPIKESISFFSKYNLNNKTFFTHFNHTNPLLKKENTEYKALIENGFKILEEKMIFKI